MPSISLVFEASGAAQGATEYERASEREFAKFLLEKAVDPDQITVLIQQAIDERAIHIRNMTWLQDNIADKLGDFFDGDLIEKIRGAL